MAPLGSVDFIGLSYYGMKVVNRNKDIKDLASLNRRDYPSNADSSPAGLRRMLSYTKDRYENVPVVITRNGVWDSAGDITDSFRSDFLTRHIDEVLKGVFYGFVELYALTVIHFYYRLTELRFICLNYASQSRKLLF